MKAPKDTPSIDYSQPQSYTPKFLADKILTTRSSIEGERKLVTVLFSDVANYTAMSEELDPEEVHQIMDGCFKVLMDEIHRYEGTINQFTGDGVMALFGAPVAHEDHAQRACNAALFIQKAMREYEEKINKEHGVEFKMRIGLNSGPVIVGSIGDDLRMDYTAVGDTTNLAARIQQAASPRQVCISIETRNLVKDFFHDKPLGEITMKGKAEPQPIYRVVAERTGVRTRFEAGLVRGFTELVGRRPEMEALQTELKKAKSGEAQIVDVVGEAGIGKTRLVYEFRNFLGDDVTFLPGTCIQYGGNINFLPVIDIVKAAFGIERGMSEEETGNRIAKKSAGSLAPMIPFYRSLLSLKVEDPNFEALEPEGRKFGTFEAVKNLLLALSEEKPLTIFVEDVHWIDKISEEFFTFFSRCMTDHPILMLSAYRPEGVPPWAQSGHYQRIGLETLSSKSSMRLVHNTLGGLALDPDLEQKIVEKTGGNPFFVEEIVRELREREDIIKEDDRYVCGRPIDQLEIPNTVQGVLAARMDRLSEDLKKTMQVASVIGRDFAFRILKSIMEFGDELRTSMSNLVGLEILYEKALFPDLEYIFKHALTQEVAYESLLKQRRQEIHGRIAQAIEDLYADRLEEHYELLAHHYERSGNAKRAVDYLILAGEKSIQHSAIQTAHEFFKKVLDLAENEDVHLDTKTEVRLYHGWGAANLGVGAIKESVKGFRKAVELSQRVGMIDYERISLASLALTMYFWPDRVEADRILEEGITRARQMEDNALESQILSWMCISEACYGSLYKAYEIILNAGRVAMKSKDPISINVAQTLRIWPERWLGHPEKAIELSEGAVESLGQMFDFNFLSNVVYYRGIALAEVGRIEDGIALLNHGINISNNFGPFYRHASFFNCLAYCYNELHQHKKAWHFNLMSEEMACELMETYPMGRRQYAEIAAQAKVNLMENLFDKGKIDEAWNRMESLKEESRSDDYDMVRYVWESRMNYLAAQILLQRNKIGQAEVLIRKDLERTRTQGTKKREGGFIRLLGEVQIRRNESENAIENFNESIQILREVGNPRQLWQAHAFLAAAYDKLRRVSEARNQWGEAAELIRKTANGLSDLELREGFLRAEPVREILSKAEN
jgi:class 3 adenylate cyclase/tetratricopeptide (TPR) repeat protein